MAETQSLIGRTRERAEALEAIGKGLNVLIQGKPGSGKTALMRSLAQQMESEGHKVIWIAPSMTKTLLSETARQVHEQIGLTIPEGLLPLKHLRRAKAGHPVPWSHLNRSILRLPVPDLSRLVARSIADCDDLIVFIDSLEIPPSQAEFVGAIIESAQIIAGKRDDNRRVRIDRLMWKFERRLELKPLTLEESRQLAEQVIEAEGHVRFSDNLARQRFIRHVSQDSGGNPSAIMGMIQAAQLHDEISPSMARELPAHEAGTQFIDLTPMLILLGVAFMASRYLSGGLDSQQLYIMAGLGMSAFLLIRFSYGFLKAR